VSVACFIAITTPSFIPEAKIDWGKFGEGRGRGEEGRSKGGLHLTTRRAVLTRRQKSHSQQQ